MNNPNLHSEWRGHRSKHQFRWRYQTGQEVAQKFWTKFIKGEIDCHHDVEFVDCHDKETLPHRKPDIIIKTKDSNDMDVFHIVAIGELKGEKISAAHKGQLEDYLSVLLSSQPFRNYCFGFITIRKFWWLRQTS